MDTPGDTSATGIPGACHDRRAEHIRIIAGDLRTFIRIAAVGALPSVVPVLALPVYLFVVHRASAWWWSESERCCARLGSERPVLQFDVLLHDGERRTVDRPGEVRAGPQALCPPVVVDYVGELLVEPA